MNPIRNKPIAEQRRIAEKQRLEQEIHRQALKEKIAQKKLITKTETELFRLKQAQDAKKQSELVKQAYYKELKETEDEKGDSQ